MLAKTGTCLSCGYEKIHCICNSHNQHGTTHRRNTSGQTERYLTYSNYNQEDDASRHQRYDPNDEERKFMQEYWPVNGENLATYISRTNIMAEKLIESSIYKHLYGGKKPWPCHTTTRYCPICTLSQSVAMLRDLFIALSQVQDVSELTIYIMETSGIPNRPNISFSPFTDKS